MTYDGLLLAAVAAELRAVLVGGRISKIRQPLPTDVALVVHSRGRDSRVLFSVDARFPRVYLTSSIAASPQNPYGFCMLLRKHIDGAFITAVEQVGFDRVLRVRLEAPDGNRTTLFHEIMGKHSNLVLVNDEGLVLGAAKIITSAISRERQIIPGREYLPPPGAKTDPLNVTREEFLALMSADSELLSEPRAKLIKSFNGIGPFLADELIKRTGKDDPDSVELWDQLTWLRDTVAGAGYRPVAVVNDRGRTELVYPIPTEQYPKDAQHARSSVSEALDAYYRTTIVTRDLESERTRLLVDVRRAVTARERSLKDLRDAIAEGQTAERYKALGDLIIGSMGRITKGDESVKLVDYYDPDLAEVEIPLDPTLTPRENAERYFKKYRKARDGAIAAVDRVSETEVEIYDLRAVQTQVESLGSVDQLREIRKRLSAQGLLRQDQSREARAKPSEKQFSGMRIQRTTSKEGLEILYGENSVSNDYLTTKVAAPNDMWFHARSVKGAHVVIRANNRPDAIPPGTIRQAAEVAASHSDAKHSSLVPVDYTLRKFVRKPRGSAPGYVTYQNEKTIDVTPLI